jgi:AcrR family transcriptional regulator
MARPSGVDAEQTRQRLLDVAIELFAAQGDATSLRDVARAAELSVGTVQHHFTNKAGLKEAVIEATFDELAPLQAALMGAAVQTPRDPASVLERVVIAGFTFIREHLTAARLMMRDALDAGVGHVRSRHEFMGPLLDNGSVVVAGMADIPVERARFALLTLNHLIIRFALASDDELVRWMGIERGDGPFPAAARAAATEAAIASLTRLLLVQCGLTDER